MKNEVLRVLRFRRVCIAQTCTAHFSAYQLLRMLPEFLDDCMGPICACSAGSACALSTSSAIVGLGFDFDLSFDLLLYNTPWQALPCIAHTMPMSKIS